MGDVIAFGQRARRASDQREPPAGDAQILFFLGVRYMRMDEAMIDRLAIATSIDPQDKPGGGGKRKRRA